MVGHKKKIYLADGESVELPIKTPDLIIEERTKLSQEHGGPQPNLP